MGCTSSRLVSAATGVPKSSQRNQTSSATAAGEKTTQQIMAKSEPAIGLSVSSDNTEELASDDLIVEAADAIFGPTFSSVANAANRNPADSIIPSPARDEAEAISKSKCFDATDSLDLDQCIPPKIIRLCEPSAASLTRITSISSFSSVGGCSKAVTPVPISPGGGHARKMPTPTVLLKRLADKHTSAKIGGLYLSNVYQIIANAIMAICISSIEALSYAASFIASYLRMSSKAILQAIQINPATSAPIFCAILTFTLHIVTIYGDFVYDDRAAVLSNPDVLGSRPIFPNVFTHDFWGQDMALDKSHKSYRPLAILSLRLTKMRAGVESASAFHFDNVMLHALVTYMYSIVCFQLVERFIETKRLANMSAVLASVLFAVHPIHTEPIASVVGRSDLLCGFFYLIGLWLFLNGKQHTALVAGVCATFSKELGVTIFGVYIMSDFLSVYTSKSQCLNFWRSSAKNIAAAVLTTATHLRLHGNRLMYSWTILENSVSMLDSRKERIFSYAHIHAVYLWKLCYPWSLSYDYGYPCLPHQTSLSWMTAVAYSVVLGLFFVAMRRRNAIMLWGLVLTLVPFIPASNIFFPVGTIVAERLLYLPSMGFCLLTGVAMSKLVDRQNNIKSGLDANADIPSQLAEAAYLLIWIGSRFLPSATASKLYALLERACRNSKRVMIWSRTKLVLKGITFIVFCAYICFMAVKSFHRSNEWQNESTLFSSAFDVCPTSLKVLNNYAFQFISTDPQHAIPYLERAVEMHGYAAANFNLGVCYQNVGRFRDAMASFEKSLALSPSYRTRILLARAAHDFLHENSAEDNAHEIATYALEHLDFVIEHSDIAYPRAFYLRCQLGQLLGQPVHVNLDACKNALLANRSAQSTEEMKGFFVIEDVVLNTIGLLTRTENSTHAIEYFNEGLRINPTSSDILVNLASTYSAQEQHDQATMYFERAERIIADPAVRSLLMTNRGFSLEQQGFYLAAKAIYEQAIDIAGSSPHPQLVLNLQNLMRYCQQNACN